MKNWRYDLSSNTNKSYINIEDQRITDLLNSNSTDSSVVFFSIAPIAIINVNPEYKENFDKITTEDNFSFSWLAGFDYSWNECSTNRINDFKFTAQIPPDNGMSKNYGYVLGIYDNRLGINESVPFIFVPTGSNSDDSKVTYLNPFCSNFLMIDLTEYDINAVIRVNNLNNIIDEHDNLVIGPNMYHSKVATSNEPKNLAITDEMIDTARSSEIELQDTSLTPTKSSNVINIYNPEEWYHMGDFTIRLLGRNVLEVGNNTSQSNVNLLSVNTPDDANNRKISFIKSEHLKKKIEVTWNGESNPFIINSYNLYDTIEYYVPRNNRPSSIKYVTGDGKKELVLINNWSTPYLVTLMTKDDGITPESYEILVPNNSRMTIKYSTNKEGNLGNDGKLGFFNYSITYNPEFTGYINGDTSAAPTKFLTFNDYKYPGKYLISSGSFTTLLTNGYNDPSTSSSPSSAFISLFSYGAHSYYLNVTKDRDFENKYILKQELGVAAKVGGYSSSSDAYRHCTDDEMTYTRYIGSSHVNYEARQWRLNYTPNTLGVSVAHSGPNDTLKYDYNKKPGISRAIQIAYPYTDGQGGEIVPDWNYSTDLNIRQLSGIVTNSTSANTPIIQITGIDDPSKIIATSQINNWDEPLSKDSAHSINITYANLLPFSMSSAVFKNQFSSRNTEFYGRVTFGGVAAGDISYYPVNPSESSGTTTGYLRQRVVKRSSPVGTAIIAYVQEFVDTDRSRLWIRETSLGQYETSWSAWKNISGTYNLTINWSAT